MCAAVWYYNIRCVLREKVFFFVRSAAIFFAAQPRRAQPEGAVLWKEKGDRIMDLKELYDQIGGNYQETISRLPSEPMVKKFVLKYPADPTYAQLQAAIAQKDWETAFRAAHTLKGVAQNLGFDRLYTAVFALTEQLRGGKPMQDEQDWLAVQQAKKTVLDGIAQFGQQ